MALRAVCRKHPTNFIDFNRQPVAYSFILHNCVFFMARACELASLELGTSILRLGASRGLPLILIRGPCLAHSLLMILSSSCDSLIAAPAEAWLTSIVNFFILLILFLYHLMLFFLWRLELEAWGLGLSFSFYFFYSISGCAEPASAAGPVFQIIDSFMYNSHLTVDLGPW